MLLHRHFERVEMPDNEYIQLVEIIISAGASIAKESGYLPAEVQAFEAALRLQAKEYWLATCAKNIFPQEDQDDFLAKASREYDNILKQKLKSKRKGAHG